MENDLSLDEAVEEVIVSWLDRLTEQGTSVSGSVASMPGTCRLLR